MLTDGYLLLLVLVNYTMLQKCVRFEKKMERDMFLGLVLNENKLILVFNFTKLFTHFVLYQSIYFFDEL